MRVVTRTTVHLLLNTPPGAESADLMTTLLTDRMNTYRPGSELVDWLYADPKNPHQQISIPPNYQPDSNLFPMPVDRGSMSAERRIADLLRANNELVEEKRRLHADSMRLMEERDRLRDATRPRSDTMRGDRFQTADAMAVWEEVLEHCGNEKSQHHDFFETMRAEQGSAQLRYDSITVAEFCRGVWDRACTIADDELVFDGIPFDFEFVPAILCDLARTHEWGSATRIPPSRRLVDRMAVGMILRFCDNAETLNKLKLEQ